MRNSLIIYTDGACSGNPGPGGYAFIILDDNKILYTKQGFSRLTTNNRMELLAPIRACMYIKDTLDDAKNLVIHTDSNYLKEGITNWITKWRLNSWKNSARKPVKNLDLWRLLDELCNGLDLSWVWVRGHSGDRFNNLVDKLARDAIRKGLNGEMREDPLGAFNVKEPREAHSSS